VTLVLPVADADRVIEATRYDKACSATFIRSLRTKAGGKRATEEEVQELLRVQRGHCYYCYGRLDKPGRLKVRLYRDHYVSLTDGGTNQIDNIVLTCSQCSTQKHLMTRDAFVTFSMMGMPAQTRTLLRRLHNEVRDWRGSRPQ